VPLFGLYAFLVHCMYKNCEHIIYMALLSTRQELNAIREAIQALISSGASSVTIDGVNYIAISLPQLQRRELELYRRLSRRHQLKRTTPDFS